MGSLVFEPKILADHLAELVGYKAGVALSLESMCDFLSGSYADEIVASEHRHVRLRSEEYEDLFYKLLHRVGHTEEEFSGDVLGTYIWHKYKEHREVVAGVVELFTEVWPRLMAEAEKDGRKAIDPSPYIEEAEKRYGALGRRIALEKIIALDRGLCLSPHKAIRYVEWSDKIALDALFKGTSGKVAHGTFLDQRYIDFLSNNREQLPNIHWRKFEELTAEFFARNGFRVELGPGRNDDGVDVRVWEAGLDSEHAKPTCIVQCKRQKDKVNKVVVKGLYADVQHEGADYGLLVTTNELSPGARTTIRARGYPIIEANSGTLAEWLGILRTPGTGIVRV